MTDWSKFCTKAASSGRFLLAGIKNALPTACQIRMFPGTSSSLQSASERCWESFNHWSWKLALPLGQQYKTRFNAGASRARSSALQFQVDISLGKFKLQIFWHMKVSIHRVTAPLAESYGAGTDCFGHEKRSGKWKWASTPPTPPRSIGTGCTCRS